MNINIEEIQKEHFFYLGKFPENLFDSGVGLLLLFHDKNKYQAKIPTVFLQQ